MFAFASAIPLLPRPTLALKSCPEEVARTLTTSAAVTRWLARATKP